MTERFLVAWECDKCHRKMTGYLATGTSTERGECGSNYAPGKANYPLRVRKSGVILPYTCTGTMTVMLDDRPPKLNVLVMERDPPLTEREKALELGGNFAKGKHRSA